MAKKKSLKKKNDEVLVEDTIDLDEEFLDEAPPESIEEEQQSLKIGQKVPNLNNLKWIKGSPIDIGSRLCVVEIWATWCGPCLQSIPHLTQLQARYKDKIDFVGISQEDEKTVKPFVKKMDSKMDYRVAIATDDTVYSQYMAGIGGIPHAFLIDDSGKLLWQCHPMELEAILEGVVNGGLDIKQLSKLGPQKQKFNEIMDAIYSGELNDKAKDKKLTQLLTASQELLKILPSQFDIFNYTVNAFSLSNQTDSINALCEIIDGSKISTLDLVTFADSSLLNLNPTHCPYNYVIQWIERSIKKEPSNAYFYDAYSRLLYRLGMLDKAILISKKAVSLDKKNEVYKKTLEEYIRLQKLQTKVKLKMNE